MCTSSMIKVQKCWMSYIAKKLLPKLLLDYLGKAA
jgi:hypothetical protein